MVDLILISPKSAVESPQSWQQTWHNPRRIKFHHQGGDDANVRKIQGNNEEECGGMFRSVQTARESANSFENTIFL